MTHAQIKELLIETSREFNIPISIDNNILTIQKSFTRTYHDKSFINIYSIKTNLHRRPPNKK